MNIENLFLAAKTAINDGDHTVAGGIWSFLLMSYVRGGNKSPLSLKYFRGDRPYYDLAVICYGEEHKLCIPVPLLSTEGLASFFRAGTVTFHDRDRYNLRREGDVDYDYKKVFNIILRRLPLCVLKDTPWPWGSYSDRFCRLTKELHSLVIPGVKLDRVILKEGPIEVKNFVRFVGGKMQNAEEVGAVLGDGDIITESPTRYADGHEEWKDTVVGGESVVVTDESCSDGLVRWTIYIRPSADLKNVLDWIKGLVVIIEANK